MLRMQEPGIDPQHHKVPSFISYAITFLYQAMLVFFEFPRVGEYVGLSIFTRQSPR